MSIKRKQASASLQNSNSTSKKPRHNNDGSQSNSNNGRGPMDQTYGQYGAFPMNADDIDPDDTTYQEAMAYLQGVRSEAHGIPHLLVAPADEPHGGTDDEDDAIYNAGRSDARGYYANGVYTAAPTLGPTLPSDYVPSDDAEDQIDGEDDVDDNGAIPKPPRRRLTTPSNAHHTSLLYRFAGTRARLRKIPPRERFSTLDGTRHPTAIDPSKSLHKQQLFWMNVFASRMPHPLQLMAMSEDTVYELLSVLPRVMTRKYLSGRRRDKRGRSEENVNSDEDGEVVEEQKQKQRRSNVKNIGAWVWSLLAKVPDADTLDAGEVCLVRDVGKRAMRVVYEMVKETFYPNASENASNNLDAGSDEDEDDTQDDIRDKSVEKERFISDADAVSPAEGDEDRLALHALLDMVLTVVGEAYRQRDLLAARALLWESGDKVSGEPNR